jgi:hypothetical protein
MRRAFTDGSNHHPVQADDNGTWNFHVGNNTDGTFRLYIHWDAVSPNQNHLCNGSITSLQKNRTYRIELCVTRVTSTTNSMAIRIYDADDVTLMYPNLGNTKFVSDADGQTLEQFGAGFGPGRTNPGSGIDSLQLLELGCNGGPALANQPQYQYYGGVMIRNDTWCGPYAGGGVLFQSDFSTATGTTDVALLDTNKPVPWSDRSTTPNGNNVIDIIAATGLNFPTTNVARVKRPAGGQGQCWVKLSGLGTPAVGEKRFYRVYVRVAYSDTDVTSPNNHHPIQNGTTTTWNWHLGNLTDGTFKMRYYYDPNGPEVYFVNSTSVENLLSKNATYRLEWMVERTDATHCKLAVRIYNSSNVLLYDDGAGNTNMLLGSGGGVSMVGQGSSHFNMTSLDAALLDTFEMGSNGGDTHTLDEYHYFGGVMIRKDTWCGPY